MQDKFEVERRARITLEVVCDYPIECLICADKPDLQDMILSHLLISAQNSLRGRSVTIRLLHGLIENRTLTMP